MKKIAIVRRNGLGDLLCAYPLVLYLRKLYPASKITLFVDERNAPLLPYFPFPEKAVVFPKKGNKYFHLVRLAFKYRSEKFDLALSAKTSPMKMVNLFLYLLGAKKRCAFVWGKSFFINCGTRYEKQTHYACHQALKGLHLFLPGLQEIPKELIPKLRVPPEIKKRYPIDLKGPILLLSGSTTKEASRLEEQRYAAHANKIAAEYGFSILVVAQERERKRALEIAKQLKVPYNIHFPRNFDEFMVLLDAADLFFVGDGGVAHIGAALGKEEVVLFGETSPQLWKPLSEKAAILSHGRHVNLIEDEKIEMALKAKAENICGRKTCPCGP